MNLERLRERYLAYTASQRPPDRRRCPSTRRLVRSFEPSRFRRPQKGIVDHISVCPYCREEFLLLVDMQRSEARSREMAAAGNQPLSEPRKGAGKLRGGGAWQYAAVALGLVLVFSSLIIVIQQTHPPSALRAPGASIVLLAPRAGQPWAGRSLFKWQRDPRARSYVLEVFDVRMMPVWTSEAVRDSRLELPPEGLARLVPGETYYWMVTGFTGDSMKLESGLSSFRFLR